MGGKPSAHTPSDFYFSHNITMWQAHDTSPRYDTVGPPQDAATPLGELMRCRCKFTAWLCEPTACRHGSACLVQTGHSTRV